jgi:arylsulfatase A-like enzyme
VYWSDHGELAFEARQVLKDSLREPSARVPLIFAGPGVAAGRVVTAPASLLDLWPTLADLVGIRAPTHARGLSLAGALAPAYAPSAQDYGVGEFFGENSETGAFTIRQGDWKVSASCERAAAIRAALHRADPLHPLAKQYIAFGHSFPWFSHYIPQLFNVSADPLETTNEAARFPAVAAALDALLIQALGQPYEDIDRDVMANDQLIWSNYLTRNKTDADVREMMAATYKGFDETDWARVQTWISTAPSVGAT